MIRIYIFVLNMSTHSKVWYKVPVGMLQLGIWKGQKTSNSTTDPFCPRDQEPAARILENICDLGGYGAGSQTTIFGEESVGNGAATLH